jgi:magnesium transporter
VLETLTPERAADALEQMDEVDAQEYVEELAPETAGEALAHMAPDDAADILAELPADHREEILDNIPDAERGEIEALLTYPPESAGGIMSTQVTALLAGLSAGQAIAALRQLAEESEQIYYTYVVDEQRRLVGVLSLRDLLLAKDSARLRDIMIRQVTRVPATLDREDVARLLSKYGYFALPVVDEHDRLLGIVTIDDVVDVIQKEATEDMQRMVGAGGDERIDSPVRFVLKRRTLWLLINLATAFLAAAVVGAFRGTIEKLAVLAALQTIVAGQAGNTGLQSMAVMIRSLATGDVRGVGLVRILLRELWIGCGAGALVGVSALAVGTAYCVLFDERLWVAGVLGAALFSSMMIATVCGAMVPWTMRRLGFDPAQSASIILTTITDVSGFAIFLAFATLILWLDTS